MKKNAVHRVRSRLIILIIPIIAVLAIGGSVLYFLEAYTSLIEAANRHLAYKAEQLRDYINSEWDVIVSLGLSESPEYRKAAEHSFDSFALALLRTESEAVVVCDAEGSLIRSIGYQGLISKPDATAAGFSLRGVSNGWFVAPSSNGRRIGVAFDFEPFGWRIAVTESHERFLSGAWAVLRFQIAILVIALGLAILLIRVHVNRVLRPVEHLAGTIELISDTHNLSHRALIEGDDEIGFIAERFNNMVSTLEVFQEQIHRSSLAEAVSRKKAIQGELETLYILGRVSDFRDEATGQHQERISSLTKILASLAGYDANRQELILNASRLHDIGKIAIPDSVLLKKDILTESEFDVIKTHTTLGYDLLRGSQSEILAEGATIAYTHHERWDGQGYPRGLSGESIPLSGRIVSILDVFDALLSVRPYKQAWSVHDSRSFIVSQRGTKFDPNLVDLFDRHFSRFQDQIDTFTVIDSNTDN